MLDVAVIGAGPTGLMLASELALAGVDVEVYERRREPQKQSRALTLHPRSIEIMDLRGYADRFLDNRTTFPSWHFAGLDTRLDFSGFSSRHPYTLSIPQSETETLLSERVSQLGVPVHRDREVTRLHDGRESMEVVFADRAQTSVHARYVVGCDGSRSVVRKSASITFDGTDETFTGILGDFASVDSNSIAHARSHGVLVVPLENGLTRFVLSAPDRMRVSSSEPVTVEEVRQALISLCGNDCGVADAHWLSRFGNATRLAGQYRSGRVFLAGDAAHIHFPAAGQGLNAGLQDAFNLGWKLAAEIHGWAPTGLLDTYQHERRQVGQMLTDNTQVQTLLLELALIPQYAPPLAALRSLFDRMLNSREINHQLAGEISGLSTTYIDPEGDPLVGRRVIDLALSTPDGSVTRVADLMHSGRFLLLDFTGAQSDECADHVTTPVLTDFERHPEYEAVHEILIRPDGHIAWVGRAADPIMRRRERRRALSDWIGQCRTESES
ncbi:FAD-dependent monooxygenase [Rhodococcus erythropolis]|uniref:FAD-dependent monooxygenase n=1 Tax=Rhodococcus erythropolis TaxID=1833 RepID=UPI0030132878